MKKYIMTVVALMTATTGIYAQETVRDTTWKTGGVISLNFTQAYYENWTAGGKPSVSGIGFLKLFATYEKNKLRWDNQLDLSYGVIRERQATERKTDDKINFDSKLGYNLGKSWYASLLTAFRTQFTPGYEDPEFQLVKISDFMSPAYLTISAGADYNPNENFSLFIAPISAKTTIVLDQELADRGSFGVQPGDWETIVRDTSGTIDSTFIPGQQFRYEIGAHLKLMYKANIWTNVDFLTKLELYANYIDNFGNIDVNWEGLINMKVNDYLAANIRVELIYDDDIAIPTGTDEAGITHYGPRVQIKQLLGIGLSYKF
jgi:hypothetical protein